MTESLSIFFLRLHKETFLRASKWGCRVLTAGILDVLTSWGKSARFLGDLYHKISFWAIMQQLLFFSRILRKVIAILVGIWRNSKTWRLLSRFSRNTSHDFSKKWIEHFFKMDLTARHDKSKWNFSHISRASEHERIIERRRNFGWKFFKRLPFSALTILINCMKIWKCNGLYELKYLRRNFGNRTCQIFLIKLHF